MITAISLWGSPSVPWGYACDDCRQSTAGRCWKHNVGNGTAATTYRFWLGVTINGWPVLVANR